MVENFKNFGWFIMICFSISVFIQGLITLEPRVSKLEERINSCEKKVSSIEIKLDTLLTQTTATAKDIKDIYHIIIKQQK